MDPLRSLLLDMKNNDFIVGKLTNTTNTIIIRFPGNPFSAIWFAGLYNLPAWYPNWTVKKNQYTKNKLQKCLAGKPGKIKKKLTVHHCSATGILLLQGKTEMNIYHSLYIVHKNCWFLNPWGKNKFPPQEESETSKTSHCLLQDSDLI